MLTLTPTKKDKELKKIHLKRKNILFVITQQL